MTREEICQMLQDIGLDGGGLDYDGADNWWTWSLTTDELLHIISAFQTVESLRAMVINLATENAQVRYRGILDQLAEM